MDKYESLYQQVFTINSPDYSLKKIKLSEPDNNIQVYGIHKNACGRRQFFKQFGTGVTGVFSLAIMGSLLVGCKDDITVEADGSTCTCHVVCKSNDNCSTVAVCTCDSDTKCTCDTEKTCSCDSNSNTSTCTCQNVGTCQCNKVCTCNKVCVCLST